jgi:tyrosine-protein kinase Etk/Wzc
MDNEHSSDTHRDPAAGAALWEILRVLASWRRFIIINVLAVTVLAVAVSFLLPKWYKATASILPPKEPDVFGSLGSAGSLLRGLTPGRALKGLGGSSGAYNYFAILKSRGAMEAVVRRFDLVTVYDVGDSSMEKAVKTLSGNVSFEMQEDDNIVIEVLDQDPGRAAAMANYFVDILNDISMHLGTIEGRNNREFIEKRLDRSKEDLRSAEDSLRRYQERAGMIIMPDAGASSVAPIAEMYGVKARKEVELAILRHTSSGDSPPLKQMELELAELDRKIGTFPGIGVASLRLYREVAIQQKIIEFLVPLYEQAKINEQKDVPVLLVLDKAVTPERKTKPQRMLIVFLAASLTLLLSMVAAFVMQGVVRHAPASSLEERVRSWVLRTARRYRIDTGR